MPEIHSIKKLGRPRTRVERICEQCGAKFTASAYRVSHGWGKFCSQICHGKDAAISIEDRFVKNIGPRQPNGCIYWTGIRSTTGYGWMTYSVKGKTKGIFAHRYAYERIHGRIDNDLRCLHKCDTPICVAVEHLWLGTCADNSADMASKGRSCRGEKQNSAKLTEAKVAEIRKRHYSETITQKKLAAEYGITQGTLSVILSGKTWKHVI